MQGFFCGVSVQPAMSDPARNVRTVAGRRGSFARLRRIPLAVSFEGRSSLLVCMRGTNSSFLSSVVILCSHEGAEAVVLEAGILEEFRRHTCRMLQN
jgi:hypothetical protein